MTVSRVRNPIAALEKIGELFYREREVDLPGGHKCLLAPLGAAQEAKANARVQEYRAVHFLKAVKVEQLAYAIVDVDGQRFEKPAKSDGSFDEEAYEAQADEKRTVLETWPEGIVTYLFNELCLLQDEVEALVSSEVKTEIPPEPDESEPDESEPDEDTPGVDAGADDSPAA